MGLHLKTEMTRIQAHVPHQTHHVFILYEMIHHYNTLPWVFTAIVVTETLLWYEHAFVLSKK